MRSTTGLSSLGSFVLAVLFCLLSACAGTGDRSSRRAEGRAMADDRAEAVPDASSSAGFASDAPTKLPFELGAGGWDDRIVATGADQAEPQAPAPAREQLLIYRGQVRVEVSKPDDVMANFRAQVAAWGGHLQRQTDRTLVVRVPQSRFEEAFAWVRAAGRVLAESRQTDDVTEEFVDLGIRLDTARKARDRLLEVLKTAEKVEDVLKVEAELRRLTEEIERMEGRRKMLADQVAMSTLEATFQPVTEVPVGKRSRQPNRFAWINRIGAERVMEDF